MKECPKLHELYDALGSSDALRSGGALRNSGALRESEADINAQGPDDPIASWALSGRAVLVYVSGAAAADLIGALRARGVLVGAVVDDNTHRTECAGLPVVTLQSAADKFAQAPIVIGVFNYAVDVAQIRRRAQQLGFGEVWGFAQVHRYLSEALGERFWLTHPRELLESRDEALACLEFFQDETSRQLYQRVLAFRLTGDEAYLPDPDLQGIYFPADLPALPDEFVMIDGGAYVGDTLQTIDKLQLKARQIAFFEPEPTSFAQLAQLAQAHTGDTVMQLWPCALAERLATLRFSSQQGAASCLSEQGDSSVTAVALDEVLPGLVPDLIKLDVEGAEPEALRGARRMIRDSRCRLAVSTYHKPRHHFQLLSLLRELCGADAQFYLRSHGYQSFDTVVYVLR